MQVARDRELLRCTSIPYLNPHTQAEWYGKPTHVLLISDPQVRHPSVLWGERSWAKTLGQFLYEVNLRRSWHVTRRLNPHAVFFLGDMLSSGKYVRSEAEWVLFSHVLAGSFAN